MASEEAAVEGAARDQAPDRPDAATPESGGGPQPSNGSPSAPDSSSGRPRPPDPDWEDRWRRAVADLDNARKRFAREMERVRANERAMVASQLLPVLDNLELALTHAEADPETIVAGVQAVRDQAMAVLAGLGYPRQQDAEHLGAPFDPARHEVVTVVDEPDAEPGTVVRVLRPGYGEGDAQLRPVAVAVARQHG
ncbi:MAG: molecular chaperone GrpE [Pseudonocardiales bacterium]|jgi:molecular chaperone GrpE|nr:molecular chaperone GrpE [Pseudonocardiales bacterium]